MEPPGWGNLARKFYLAGVCQTGKLTIRVNPKPDETLIGRIFLRDRLVVVASPSLAKPTDGQTVPAVVARTSGQSMWEFATADGQCRINVDPVLRLASLIMIRDATRRGVGVARLPVSLVASDLAAGTLVKWGDVEGPDIELWTLYPSRRLLNARVSAFLDFFKKSFPNGTPDELSAYITR